MKSKDLLSLHQAQSLILQLVGRKPIDSDETDLLINLSSDPDIFLITNGDQIGNQEAPVVILPFQEDSCFQEAMCLERSVGDYNLILIVGQLDKRDFTRYIIYTSEGNFWLIPGSKDKRYLIECYSDICWNGKILGYEARFIGAMYKKDIAEEEPTADETTTEETESQQIQNWTPTQTVSVNRNSEIPLRLKPPSMHKAFTCLQSSSRNKDPKPSSSTTNVLPVRMVSSSGSSHNLSDRNFELRKIALNRLCQLSGVDDISNVTEEHYTIWKNSLLSKEGQIKDADSGVLICYNARYNQIFAVPLPHPGRHSGIAFCRHSNPKLFCPKSTYQKSYSCVAHELPGGKVIVSNHLENVRKHIRDLYEGNPTQNDVVDFAENLKNYLNNVVILDNVTILTSSPYLVYYSLISNCSLTRICGVEGCLNATPAVEDNSCMEHNKNLKYFAVEVGDSGNLEERVCYFAVVKTCKLTKNGFPVLDTQNWCPWYKEERMDNPWQYNIIRVLELPTEEIARETASSWLIARLLTSWKTNDILILNDSTCPVNSSSMLLKAIYDENLQIFITNNKLPRSGFFDFEKGLLKKDPHCYLAVTNDGGVYVGKTCNYKSIVDPYHYSKATSALFKYYQKDSNFCVVKEDIFCRNTSTERNSYAEALLQLCVVLMVNLRNVNKWNSDFPLYCLNRRILLGDLRCGNKSDHLTEMFYNLTGQILRF